MHGLLIQGGVVLVVSVILEAGTELSNEEEDADDQRSNTTAGEGLVGVGETCASLNRVDGEVVRISSRGVVGHDGVKRSGGVALGGHEQRLRPVFTSNCRALSVSDGQHGDSTGGVRHDEGDQLVSGAVGHSSGASNEDLIEGRSPVTEETTEGGILDAR